MSRLEPKPEPTPILPSGTSDAVLDALPQIAQQVDLQCCRRGKIGVTTFGRIC